MDSAAGRQAPEGERVLSSPSDRFYLSGAAVRDRLRTTLRLPILCSLHFTPSAPRSTSCITTRSSSRGTRGRLDAF